MSEMVTVVGAGLAGCAACNEPTHKVLRESYFFSKAAMLCLRHFSSDWINRAFTSDRHEQRRSKIRRSTYEIKYF